MDALVTIIPWALFGVMVVFGLVFAILALRAGKRAIAAESQAEQAQMHIGQVMQRAQSAEAMIAEAQQRATAAEQRIAQAEAEAARARDAAAAAEQRAASAEERARQAIAAAQAADQSLRERKDAQAEKARKAEQRARTLLDWARTQWEARREPDRQKAQGQQGSFQAQLEAFLEYRRAPISFRVDNEVDRLAAPLIGNHAQNNERVDVQGDLVRISFPVDPALGFRA